MLKEPITADEYEIFGELCGKTGTLVIWSKCDRLLSREYDDPGGAREKAAIRRLDDDLKRHLGLIYYRFLDLTDDRERECLCYPKWGRSRTVESVLSGEGRTGALARAAEIRN